jgi:glycosyltransferase involved in cell wall biosynthesis
MGYKMISVVICTYNRQDSLRRTLISLGEMFVPVDLSWELIIVDNNSRDETKRVVHDFIDSSKISCKYVFERVQGKTYALNRGVKEAKGDIIALTDDDVIVDKNWLLNIQNAFKDNNVACLGGKILPIWEKPRPEWLEGKCLFDILAIVDLGNEMMKLSKPIIWGANLSMKSSVFKNYGYFDTSLGHMGGKIYGDEDTEMVRTILNNNETVIYSPNVLVYHCIPGKRLKRSYFRKWVYDKGHLRATQLGRYTKRNLMGIPYLWIKKTVYSFIEYIVSKIISPKKAFEKELRFIHDVGKCIGRIQFRNI